MAGHALAEPEDLDLSMNGGVVSRHVYRGIERSGNAWQVAVDGAWNGWRGNVWSSHPLDSTAPGEVRSRLGYVWAVTPTLSLETSGTHFWYVDSPVPGAPAHSFEANVRLTWTDKRQVRWSLESGYDIRFHSLAVEGALAYDLPLPRWGTYLQGRAYVGHLGAADVLPDATVVGGSDDYEYWGADLRLPYRISWHTTLALSAHYAEAADADRYWSPRLAGPGRRAWFGFSTSYTF